MSRRSWTWGAGLAALGLIITIAGAHAMAAYTHPAGSVQTVTLGQLVSVVFGAALLLAGGLVLVTGVRRTLALRRRRRMLERLAARDR